MTTLADTGSEWTRPLTDTRPEWPWDREPLASTPAGVEQEEEPVVLAPGLKPCKRCGGPADVHRGRWQQTCATCRPILVAEAKAAGQYAGGSRPAAERVQSPAPAQPTPETGWLSEENVRGARERVQARTQQIEQRIASPTRTVERASAEHRQLAETARACARGSRTLQDVVDGSTPRGSQRIPTIEAAVADVVEASVRLQDRLADVHVAREVAKQTEKELEAAAQAYLGGLDRCRNALLIEIRRARGPVDTSQ